MGCMQKLRHYEPVAYRGTYFSVRNLFWCIIETLHGVFIYEMKNCTYRPLTIG